MNKKIFEIPEEDILCKGHMACIGCGVPLAMKFMLKGLGRKTILAVPACCYSVIDGTYPFSASGVPFVHVPIPAGAAVASGIRAGLDMIGDTETNVVAWAGDGGTYDIGFQALSGASERDENIIYVCYDNEAYMNTGIQRSSSTPYGASTTTSPAGKVIPGQITWKKNMPEIAAAHNIPYVATACPSYPIDLVEKVKKAARLTGPAYVHILSVCPTGWRLPPELSIKAGRLAVETGVFPLYEVEHGRYRFTGKIEKLRHVKEYLKIQGRFRHLSEEMINTIQKRVVEEYEKLQKKVEMTEGD